MLDGSYSSPFPPYSLSLSSPRHVRLYFRRHKYASNCVPIIRNFILISLFTDAITPTILVTDKNPADSPYNYIPTESIAIVFIVLFGLSTGNILPPHDKRFTEIYILPALHTGQSLYHRLWWLLPTAVLAGLLEVLGWSARLWSSINPPNSNAFEMQ